MTVATPAMAQEKNILLILWRGITEPEVALKEKLAALGVQAKYTEVVGNQDRGVMAGRLRALEEDIAAKKFDIAYSFGTTTTQVAQQIIQDRIPIVFNIVFDPVGGKLVKSMEEPGVNTTGVTNGVPIDLQLSAFNKLAPLKKLLVLFNAREPNAKIIEAQVTEWSAKNGVELTSRRVAPDTDALDEVMAEIKSGKLTVDAVYAGADSYLGSKAGDIQKAVGDRVNLFGGTQTFVLNKWLAAYTPLVEDMGGTAAEMIAKVLKGEDARKMPVVLPQPKLIVSKSTADLRKVAVPADAVTNP
ncbi:ABC transporter substrate binding protein [Azospirillum sp. B506]|uniref:ABC transporter substrate binding protein n=1 Tax=Azospirillum sp. B506 TaxID=137721 RepID=UPI00131ED4D0|nr:ABC transporter substrate binding protein [Azospirillum sp. B506]